jgi:LysM repeat protein
MNTSNPLPLSGGSQPPRFHSNIKIAVISILALHAVLFGGLLLQGCKRESADVRAEPTNAFPVFDPVALPVPQPEPVPPPLPAAAPQLPEPAPAPGTVPPGAVPGLAADPNMVPAPPPPAPTPLPAPVPATSEHIVVKGESFTTIAKQHGITIAALAAANPGVDSRRLQIGQKLVIPPPTAAPAPAPASEPAGGPQTYTVRSGDTLTKIATNFKTTVKALRAANNLKTDQIKVGQKLVIPPPPGPGTP